MKKFDAILSALDAGSTVINIGSGSGKMLRALVAALERVLGRSIPNGMRRPRAADTCSYANIDNAPSLMGWEPVPLR